LLGTFCDLSRENVRRTEKVAENSGENVPIREVWGDKPIYKLCRDNKKKIMDHTRFS